jgi:hypothetical protein
LNEAPVDADTASSSPRRDLATGFSTKAGLDDREEIDSQLSFNIGEVRDLSFGDAVIPDDEAATQRAAEALFGLTGDSNENFVLSTAEGDV